MLPGLVVLQPSSIKYHDIRYSCQNGSKSSTNVQTSSSTKQSQAPPPPEATHPTITVETPQGGSVPPGPAKAPSSTDGSVASSSSQSLSSQEHSVTQSVASTSSWTSDPTSSTDTVVISSSHSPGVDSTPLCSEDELAGLAGEEGAATVKKLPNQQRSPPVGDIASVVRGVVVSTGSDIIASAAQIKVMEPLESAGSHSPTPARSGSPVPIPVTGDEAVEEISTKVKSEALLPTPTTSSTLALKQGQQLVGGAPKSNLVMGKGLSIIQV